MKDNIIKFPHTTETEIIGETEEPVFYCTPSIFKLYRTTYFLLGASLATGCVALLLILLNMFFGHHLK